MTLQTTAQSPWEMGRSLRSFTDGGLTSSKHERIVWLKGFRGRSSSVAQSSGWEMALQPNPNSRRAAGLPSLMIFPCFTLSAVLGSWNYVSASGVSKCRSPTKCAWRGRVVIFHSQQQHPHHVLLKAAQEMTIKSHLSKPKPSKGCTAHGYS